MTVGSDGSGQSSANEMQTAITRGELSLMNNENQNSPIYSIKSNTNTGFHSRRRYSRKI